MAKLNLDAKIGIVIRDLRLSRGWTQADLAAKAGVTQAAISLIETGRRGKTLSSLQSIALALGQRLGDLVNFAESTADLTEDLRSSIESARRLLAEL